MIHQQNTARSNLTASVDMSSLVSWPSVTARTVPLDGRQARVRLETAVWEGLDEISQQVGRPISDLCGELNAARPANIPLTSAIRNYVLAYFRDAENS